jgi:hypothetical protein
MDTFPRGSFLAVGGYRLQGDTARAPSRRARGNLVRAGVPEGVAMKLTGDLTRSAFEHYNIASNADLEDAVRYTRRHGSAELSPEDQLLFANDHPRFAH